MPAMQRERSDVRLLEGETLADAPIPSAREVGRTHLPSGAERVVLDDELLSRHVLCLGSIGSGKTNAMFHLLRGLRATATDKDVFVVFDSKGDFCEEFFEQGDVVLSSSRNLGEPGKRLWNVFEDLRTEDPALLSDQVSELAATLFSTAVDQQSNNGSIFPHTAQDLFGSLLDAMVRDEMPYTNQDLRALIDLSSVPQMRDLLKPHADLRGALAYLGAEGSATTQSTLIYLQQVVRSTFTGAFRLAGDFSVRRFVRKKGGRALFIEYDVGASAMLGPIYRVLLDLAMKEGLARERSVGNVFFVLDEFALAPGLEHIESAINFGRGLGLKFIVGVQNVGQVLHAYDEARGESILSGLGTVFAFRLFDQASRDMVAMRFGANRKLVRFDSALRARGFVEQAVTGRVIEDWDLAGLVTGESVVCMPEGPPFRLRLDLYSGR